MSPERTPPISSLSIAKKLARSNFLASGVALVLATTAFLSYDFLSFRRITVETLAGYADMIGINSAAALIFDDKDAAADTLGSLRVRRDILAAAVYDQNGRRFAAYHANSAAPEPPAVLAAAIAERRGYWMERGHIVLVDDIHFRDQYLGVVYLEAGLEELRERAARYVGIAVVVFLVSILVAWLVSRQLQRRITGPIFGLTHIAEQVSREADYSVRAQKQSDDEVGVLAEAFNNMLGQIQLQNEALNRARGELERRVVERTRELADEVDIRRRTEEALRENEERFRTLVESAPDAVITVGGEGDIVLVNNQAEKLFGYPREELLGKSVDMLVPPEYRDGQEEDWLRAALDPAMTMRETAREFEALTKDGRRLPVEVRLGAIRARGEVLVLAVIRNISARKEAERAITALNRQLAENVAELTAVNSELEAFSYSVSHDLRAPLRAIDGFSQSLVEDCAAQLDATGIGYLERIRAGAQRMGMLIDDLLNLSRITRASLMRETVDMSAIVEGIFMQLAAGEPRRVVQTIVAPGVTAHADARLIRIALENLLSNAWKFTRRSADAVIEFGARVEHGETVYFVRDNGAGFNMEYAGKLFEAFQRLHSEREYEGTGIGLAIVLRIINRHGGRIWAEGQVGHGAVFNFTVG